jgi:hypothetical protein
METQNADLKLDHAQRHRHIKHSCCVPNIVAQYESMAVRALLECRAADGERWPATVDFSEDWRVA